MASEAEELEAMARRLAEVASDRPEAARAGRLARRLADGRFLVSVVGELNRGKSTLVNALVGAEVLPTGVLPLTAVATELAFGSRSSPWSISTAGPRATSAGCRAPKGPVAGPGRAAGELDKHAGGARWDLTQRLDGVRGRFEAAMRAELDAAADAILAAAAGAEGVRVQAGAHRAGQRAADERQLAVAMELAGLAERAE